jgi:hypothetical protein
MSGESLTVVQAGQSGTRLVVVVKCPTEVMTLALSTPSIVSMVDVLGREVPVKVKPHDNQPALLAIEADLVSADPEADAPSYRLTVGQLTTWFAPAGPRGLSPGTSDLKPPPGATSIDYLGRDYTAFTAMMRSRVAEIVHGDAAWALDHPADPMTTILDVLAYAGDHLSFRQDAAGTESYLTTARHRLSLRRHGRLRDYPVNDGCNARTALAFAVSVTGVLPAGLQVVTLQPGYANVILPPDAVLAASTTVFETMHDQPVSAQLNDLGWALQQGAAHTVAAGSIALKLQGRVSGLIPGQLLALRQLDAPEGVASPFGAQILRLLKVEEKTGNGGAVGTLLSWHPEDALKCPLIVPPARKVGTVSLYGNVVLADHGRTLPQSSPIALKPAKVPASGEYAPVATVEDIVSAAPPPRFAAAFDGTQDIVDASLMVESAKASLEPDPREAAPCITMSGTRPGMAGVTDVWHARQDLLSTPSTGRAFAVSLEDGSGDARRCLKLSFGQDAFGYAPAPDTSFTASVRSGDGQSGRVHANSLLQVIGPNSLIRWVSNPLPASPSVEESSEAIRLFAANSFRTNLRGIEPGDWERLAKADPLVTEVHATLDPDGQTPCKVGLITTIPGDFTLPVASARLMEYAVLGAPPTICKHTDVDVAIALIAYCVPGANIAVARERLQQRLGAGTLPDGSPAFFNPANWPLGRQVRLAEIVSALSEDPSVAFVVSDPEIDPRVVFKVTGDDKMPTNLTRGFIAIDTHQRVRVGNEGSGSVRIYVAAS